MSDVNAETLQDLMERRLKELGQRRGRGEQISLHEAYDRLVASGAKDVPTYEVFRRIRQGHSKITDRTADALATMLGVDVDQVLVAAGQRPRLTRFELPMRADRLTESERKAVLGVVDAILEAGPRVDLAWDQPVQLRTAEDMQRSQRAAARRED